MQTLNSLPVEEQMKLTQCEYKFELTDDIDQYRHHPDYFSHTISPSSTNITPLIYACQQGDLTLVTALIKLGASIEKVGGGEFRTPLMCAAAAGNADVLDFLIKKGANPNAYSITFPGQRVTALDLSKQRTWLGFWDQKENTCFTLLKNVMASSDLNEIHECQIM